MLKFTYGTWLISSCKVAYGIFLMLIVACLLVSIGVMQSTFLYKKNILVNSTDFDKIVILLSSWFQLEKLLSQLLL